jgi:cysteine desulfurase
MKMVESAERLTVDEATDSRNPIYFDYQATTPLDPRVLEAMLPYLRDQVGNPHSTSHLHGLRASAAVEEARAQVAALIGARPGEIVFTSGATEANNQLIRGAAAAGARVGRTRVVTCVTEHHAVLDVARRLAADGFEVIELGVDHAGFIDLDELADAVDGGTALVSIMAANNEIGVLQPIAEAASRARQHGALFHSDGAQAVGKIPVDVGGVGIDLLSLSGHKLYGPMGIGVAYIARHARRRVDPLFHGGGQEGGFRSGTLPVALCVGLGEACRIAQREFAVEAVRLEALRSLFLGALRQGGTDFVINGDMDRRLPGNLNISFPGVDSEALLMRLRADVSLASGSACTTTSLEPSHVIQALGFGSDRAEEAIRIGFGRPTSEADTVAAARLVTKAVARLRGVGYRPGREGP